MSDFTIEQLEALKEGTTPGPWKVRRDKWGGGLDCPEIMGNEDNLRLAAAAPELVDALIAEKRAHQKLRARIGRLSDWYNERGEYMYNRYEESLDRQFKDDSGSCSFTANQLSAILDPSDEDEADNG